MRRSYYWLTKNSFISFYYRTNAAHPRGSVMWNNLDAVKPRDSLFESKNKIKYIEDVDCACLI